MSDLLERLRAAVGDRYAIESEIGRGGMAVVFLAEDLKHHRQVAIKVLHPELAATVGGDRFLREIEFATRLNHPHILSLIDSGEADGLFYYVMPYVEGESLRERLVREGQLPIDEAVRIAREVADGLGYAHRHGVIHRDIKPANIMLSEGHALVADFGVARAVGGEKQALTSTGLAVGTPAYMSPEQASGEEVDARSDLYALGCVLYEMLAGEAPLTGTTPQATAAIRLTESPIPLPVIRETVPQGIELVVSRLLSKAPADRYREADDLTQALDSPALWATTESVPRNRRWVSAVALVVVLLVAGAVAVQRLGSPSGGSEAEAGPLRVAVLPFENLTGDPSLDHLETLTANRIAARIQQEDAAAVASQSAVSAALQEVAAGDPIAAVATAVGATLVVDGEITRTADSLTFHVRLIDPATGTQTGSFSVVAVASSSPDPVLDELGSRLSGGLLVASSAEDPNWAWISYPRVEAYRIHREAVALQYDSDLEEAIERQFEARSRDSTFHLPLLYAWATARNLGNTGTADSLLDLLLELPSGVPRGLPYNLKAEQASQEGDIEAAYNWTRRAIDAGPAEWTAWLALAVYCAQLNRPHEALETILETEELLPNEPGAQALYLAKLTTVHHMLGDHSAELAAAREQEGWSLSGNSGSSYLVGRAAAALGRDDDVRAALDRLEASGDSTGWAGWLMVAIALEQRIHGHGDESEEAMRGAVRWFEAQQDLTAAGTWYRGLYGLALYHAERWEDADSVLQAVEESFPLRPVVLGYLGLSAARLGDHQRAADYAARLAEIAGGAAGIRAAASAFRARIAAVLGEKDEAVLHLKHAFDAGLGYQPGGEPGKQYRFDFEGMADYGPYQELLRPVG